jgi:hypothetical protein
MKVLEKIFDARFGHIRKLLADPANDALHLGEGRNFFSGMWPRNLGKIPRRRSGKEVIPQR